MIWVYRILFIPAFLILFPYYLRRMLRRGGYREDFLQRLGGGEIAPKAAGQRRVWLQAVSVGEIQAMEPLVARLLSIPNLQVVLTTTTSTGYTLARTKFKDTAVLVRYFPIDFWCFSKRTWQKINPDLALLAEGELWPEHLHQAFQRKVPIILLNGRLSDRSFQRFYRVRFLTCRLLRKFAAILAASDTDAQRFRKLGAPADRTHVTGNLKLEVPRGTPLSGEAKREWCKQLGFPSTDPLPKVLVGASTWPGEERFLWDLVSQLRKEDPSWVLLLVPRHAERGSFLRREFEQEPAIRFWNDPIRQPVPLVVADVTGKMRELLAGADLVFTGKSLAPHKGGQTPLEAAALSLPVVSGPHMENFRSLVTDMRQAQALLQGIDETEVAQHLTALMKDDDYRKTIGQNAARWMSNQQGTLNRIWQKLLPWLQAS